MDKKITIEDCWKRMDLIEDRIDGLKQGLENTIDEIESRLNEVENQI